MTTYYRFNPTRSKKAVQRLEKLANFLETVPRKRFDLGVIAHNPKCNIIDDVEHTPQASDRELINDLKEGACGTAACAIGWCPAVFPGLFRWVVERSYDYAEMAIEHKQSGDTDFEAVQEAFELDEPESTYLFSTEHYENRERTTAKTVANRIREFIKVGMPEDYVGY